jgi:hypothetical protein
MIYAMTTNRRTRRDGVLAAVAAICSSRGGTNAEIIKGSCTSMCTPDNRGTKNVNTVHTITRKQTETMRHWVIIVKRWDRTVATAA